ncbi:MULTISPECIES: peroxiredoxin family protein [Actinokineospora]|uniref:thioredoxin-dependent peroxiredoxin n=1 Tax=Actinokineospora fastidiosa TaxID=1816 RepID=A0A918LGI0_9PSEU|nr:MULTISPECIES: peroxiredoxin family protein [Actinokineospora]UVS78626.1 Putative peroxiredoxin [Actinokineospora sp. UTMC 2448]GGS45743.1 peroxiredoxin [Actinokineospora fastidiosa]
MLTTGSPAPEMVLEDTDGQTVRVSDHQGDHAVLLFFVRSTSCPVCTRHVRDLVARRGELEADNVRVLIAVPEDRERAARWKARHAIPFPVLTGRDRSPHELIGLTRRIFGAMQQSGSVLIDRHGIVRHAHGATLPTGSYDRQGIAAAIASSTQD